MKTGPKPITIDQAYHKLLINMRVSDNGCWLIEYGQSIGIGYKVCRAGGETWYIHRLSWYVNNGNFSSEVVRHSCDTPNCFNPEHLIEGTHADNIMDKMERGKVHVGSEVYKSVLNEEQVLDIFSNKELNYQELSDKYGISRGGIHNIKSGRSWNHVTGLPKKK